jgi:predicted ATPase/DNA-binding SARP family transcriptional activator
MARLTLSLLGAFEATLDGKSLSGIKTDKARALLIYLAVERGRAHRRQALAGLLWPDYPEEGARANLRHALANLRGVLEEEQNATPFLLVEGETLQLNPESECWVDVAEFERVSEGTASEELEGAVALYRGGFLDGFTLKDSPDFDSWTAILRERYQGMASTALGRLAETCEQSKEYEKAIGYARRRLALEPWQEEAHQQLMRSLAQNGQRASALAQYEACCKILKEELGVEPSVEMRRLQASIRAGEITGTKEEKVRKHNLPAQLTSFIGREKEIAQVKGMLSSHRLVTLTGSGGTGKTRLSLRVGGELLEQYPDGVWLVELAPLAEPELVVQSVARALGMRLEAGAQALLLLEDYLEQKHLLLILDNCEHLVEACARLADALLKACPHLHILASSREGLGIEGEAAYRVPPLSLPDPQNLPPFEMLEQYEAVQLFVERAGTTSPDFQLTPENASAVAQICQRLDGIPLALELAAARVKILQADEIAARLDDRFRLLTGGSRAALPRYQTLRASIDWSYDLLSPAEQRLLRRLSVFTGGWVLEAAEYVGCGEGIDSDGVLDLLSQLVNKSLVTVEAGGTETRYGMLETIRQYAQEKLAEANESECARDLHLMYCVEFAENVEGKIRGPDQALILDRLEADWDNISLALDWSLEGCGKPGWSPDPGLRLASALWRFLAWRGRGVRGFEHLKQLLLPETAVTTDPKAFLAHLKIRARALQAAGILAYLLSEYSQAVMFLDESKILFKSLGPEGKEGYAFSISQLGETLYWQGELSQSKALTEESLSLLGEIGNQLGESDCYWTLGLIAMSQGQYEQAKMYLEKASDIQRKAGDLFGVGYILLKISIIALFKHDFVTARPLVEEVRLLSLKTGTTGIGDANEILGEIDWVLGNFKQAECYFTDEIVVSRQLGLASFVIGGLNRLGELRISQGEYDKARELLEESLAYGHKVNSERLKTYTLSILGALSIAQGDIDLAVKRCTEALTDSLQRGSRYDEVIALYRLGKVDLMQGNFTSARSRFNEAIEKWTRVDWFLWNMEFAIEGLAFIFVAQSDLERAVKLLAVTEDWHQKFQHTRSPRERQERENAIATVSEALGEEAFAIAWKEGKAMSLEQAIAYAREAGNC